MTKPRNPSTWPLVQVKLVLAGRIERHGSLVTAMASLRPIVAIDEALRIFEKFFHL